MITIASLSDARQLKNEPTTTPPWNMHDGIFQGLEGPLIAFEELGDGPGELPMGSFDAGVMNSLVLLPATPLLVSKCFDVAMPSVALKYTGMEHASCQGCIYMDDTLVVQAAIADVSDEWLIFNLHVMRFSSGQIGETLVTAQISFQLVEAKKRASISS